MAGQRVWVVGASSGIGAALAQALARRGAAVAISARRVEALEQVAAGDMATVPLDVTDPEACTLAAEQVREALGGLDMVVWSAGHWQRFDAASWDGDDFRRHVEVNLLGMNNVLAAVVPEFVSARSGQIVGIASVAGYRGIPGAEAYGATKAAQINLLESMRGSLKRHRIRVTTVNPGFVRTPMTAVNTFPMPFMVDADDAADRIVDGLERGHTQIVFPLPMAIAMTLARFVPGPLWTMATARMKSLQATGTEREVLNDPR